MIKACVVLFCITLALSPLLAWCATVDAHSKWNPGMEFFFNELKKEADVHFKESPRSDLRVVVSTPATEYSKALQAEIENILTEAVKKGMDPHVENNSVHTSTASPQTVDHAKRVASGDPETSSYTKGSRMGSTEGSVSTENQAKKEPSVPAKPDTQSEYLRNLEAFYDDWKKYEKSVVEKDNIYAATEGSRATKEYAATEGSVSTKSQVTKEYTSLATLTDQEVTLEFGNAIKTLVQIWKEIEPPEVKGSSYATTEGSQTTKKYTKSIHSTDGYTKESVSTAGGQATPSLQDGYSTTVHQVSITPDYLRFGSVKGRPGVDFPNYTEIPLTSFNCFDKDYLPGFYADLESRCQVFHACWPSRRESFLCPLGTTFNQALMACDYWYSTNCSLAPHYYNVNAETSQLNETEGKSKTLSSMISVLLQKGGADTRSATEGSSTVTPVTPETVVSFISQFLPVKAKVVIYPDTAGKRAKIVASASVGEHTVRKVQEDKTPRQFKVVKERRVVTTETSSVPHSTEQSTSTIFPEDDSKPATDLFLKKLAVIANKAMRGLKLENYTTEPSRPVSEESKYTVHPDLREFDAAAEHFLDVVAEVIKRIFPNNRKREDQKETGSDKTESVKIHTLSQLNPRFVIKPVDVPKEEMKDTKSALHPTESSIKSSRRPTPEKPKYGTLNPRFVIKPIYFPKEESKHTKSVPHPIESSIKVMTAKKRATTHQSGQNSRLGISPLTKKSLAKNYVRFLRAKTG